MTILYECQVPDPKELFIRDPQPVICGWQAVPVTLANPYSAGLATISRSRENVSSGMTRRPAVSIALNSAAL